MRRGRLPKPSKANKGWEALAILPGSASLDKKRLPPQAASFNVR